MVVHQVTDGSICKHRTNPTTPISPLVSGRLAGNWGVVDVQDCQDAPRLLASLDEALIDGSRVAIRGGSAGGYTTLASLSVASDTTYFKAATSLFGVSDLILLSEFTHKYELKYLIKLLGGTVDEIRPVYEARSPLFHAKNITVPLLVSPTRLSPLCISASCSC